MRTEKEPICALNGKKCVSPGLFAKCRYGGNPPGHVCEKFIAKLKDDKEAE